MSGIEKVSVQSNAQRPNEEIIDLGQYFQIIGNFKWRILLLAIMVSLLTTVVAFSMPNIYSSTATLLIEAEEAKAVSIEEVYGLDSSQKEYYLTQFEILKSRRLAEKVIDRLNLASHPEFYKQEKSSWISNAKTSIASTLKSFLPVERELAGPSEEEIDNAKREALVRDFTSRLTIAPVRKTQLVRISFEAEDRKLAALVANTLGTVYIESYLEEKMGMTQKASDWIRKRLEELRVNLRASELELQAFREKHGLVDVEGVVALTSQELNELTTQLSKARQARIEAQAVIRFLDSNSKVDYSRLASMPEISGHRLIEQLKREETESENQVAQLSQRYGPKHNKMIAAQARLKEIRTSLELQISQLVAGIEQEYQTALQNESSLKQDLAEVKERYQGIARVETEYRVLAREVQANRQLYDTFLQRMKETSVVGDFQAANARFTDRAEPANLPAKPQRKKIVAASFVATLMLGVMLAFLQHSLSDTISTPEDVEKQLGQRVIGLIPQFLASDKKSLPIYSFFDEKAHTFSESWRTLRTGYVLSHMEQGTKIVSVTSTLPGEGKSTASTNLAFALAQVEKVLLIEADLRRPVLAHRFGLPNYQPGVSNLVMGTHTLEDAIHTDERSGIDVLVAGSIVPNPLEVLSNSEFKLMINKLSERYDRIVIDTPPAHVVSDAMVVARLADSVLYVVRSGHVRRKLVQEAISKLQGYKTRIDGIILNRISEKANKLYYGYDYDGYYSYSDKPSVKASGKVSEINSETV